MVIAINIMKTYNIRDIVQIGLGESPSAEQTVISNDSEIIKKRLPSMEEERKGADFRPPGVFAGQDLPAFVIDRPVQVIPKLGHDLLQRHVENETVMDSCTQIQYIRGRLETESGIRLSQMITSLRSARDRHEQNVELLRDKDDPDAFCIRTIKSIRRGQPLLIWYGEGLAREIGVPILTPANIRGNQEYICTSCHSTFTEPNVLKVHLFFECRYSTPGYRSQANLVPFHALLENISTCFISSSAKSPICSIKNKKIDLQKQLKVDTSTVIRSQNSIEDNDLASNHDFVLPRLHYGNIGQSQDRQINNPECNQSDLSPSLSSSSLDSSFLEDHEDDNPSVNASTTVHRSSIRDHVVHSAFRRPTRRMQTPEDISQMPDSSTDQRSALNLSVKEDHYQVLRSNSNHYKNFLTQPFNHSMATHPQFTHSQHIGIYPINYNTYNTLPVCYPVSHSTPSTSFDNIMSYYNQHHQHGSRTLDIRRNRFESQNNIPNTELPAVSGQTSPKIDCSMPAIPFPNPDPCPPMDHTSASVNPYGLNLPSDKEPLDLLPQTYFTNKSKRGHLCLYCGKLYSRKYGLKIHMRTHNGYKPLKCKICSRPFGDPSNLNKHVRLHAQGETPYRCDYCGKVLVRRRDLERHVRSRHPMGTVTIDTSSPPSSPISVEDIDTSSFQENVSSL